ncbi:HepT-like ribonuclease domain-containing protein [Parabacteroides sp.]
MFDKSLALECLYNIREALRMIEERTVCIASANDFLCSPDGMLRLDAVCMNLIALGESVKGFDKITGGAVLCHYPEIYWKGIMQMRDKIAHHYFDIDAGVVFSTINENISPLIVAIDTIISDIEKR